MKLLKLAQEGSDNEQIALLQSLLEDANARSNELALENRRCNQRLLEGQSQVEELQKSLQENSSKAEDVVLMKRKCQEHLEKLRDATEELKKKSRTIEELENKHSSSVERMEELDEALKKKDEEMKLMEERYKKYLEKAKSVIRTLDPKQNQGSAPEVQALKNQLQERERMLQSLEQKEYDKTKCQRDQEEKLIVSAWYNMRLLTRSSCTRLCAVEGTESRGSREVTVPAAAVAPIPRPVFRSLKEAPLGMALQKKASEERLSGSGSGPVSAQSFLNRQRQATGSRRAYPTAASGGVGRSDRKLPSPFYLPGLTGSAAPGTSRSLQTGDGREQEVFGGTLPHRLDFQRSSHVTQCLRLRSDLKMQYTQQTSALMVLLMFGTAGDLSGFFSGDDAGPPRAAAVHERISALPSALSLYSCAGGRRSRGAVLGALLWSDYDSTVRDSAYVTLNHNSSLPTGSEHDGAFPEPGFDANSWFRVPEMIGRVRPLLSDILFIILIITAVEGFQFNGGFCSSNFLYSFISDEKRVQSRMMSSDSRLFVSCGNRLIIWTLGNLPKQLLWRTVISSITSSPAVRPVFMLILLLMERLFQSHGESMWETAEVMLQRQKSNVERSPPIMMEIAFPTFCLIKDDAGALLFWVWCFHEEDTSEGGRCSLVGTLEQEGEQCETR
ncbi:hypothetical protein DNTS_005227 [Danionella cerebrum]|uniref:Hook C-terminal domain-containing protein n=1 Tax=Danionella cerebrum TaxID=2873325 RepID=A0A553QDD3_9TELE|nr:hypothetical protein DNTS_005227 [Danionella translucida]